MAKLEFIRYDDAKKSLVFKDSNGKEFVFKTDGAFFDAINNILPNNMGQKADEVKIQNESKKSDEKIITSSLVNEQNVVNTKSNDTKSNDTKNQKGDKQTNDTVKKTEVSKNDYNLVSTISFVPSSSQLTIREIQILIRSGATAEELCKKFNTPIEKIERFSEEIVRERGFIIDDFCKKPARSSRKGKILLDVISEYFDKNGIPRNSAKWSAVRGEVGPWHISIKYLMNGEEHEAVWYYAKKDKEITEANSEAQKITRYWEDIDTDNIPEHMTNTISNLPKREIEEEIIEEVYPTTTGMRIRILKDSLDENFNNIEKESKVHAENLRSLSTDKKDDIEVYQKNLEANATPDDDSTKIMSQINKISHPDTQDNDTVVMKQPLPTKKDASTNGTADGDDDIEKNNITGRYRTLWNKAKGKKRPKMPPWEEMLLPPRDETD